MVRRMSADSPSTARRGAFAIAVAACVWGLWGLVIHAAGVGGPVAACIVMFTVGTFAAPTLPKRLPRGRLAWGVLVGTGFADACNAMLYFEALKRGPMPVAVLSHYLAPVLVALATPLVFGQRPSLRVWLSLPVSLVGLALLLDLGDTGGGDVTTTALLGAGSAVFYAAQLVLQKRGGEALTPAELLVWHAWIAGVLLLPFALAGEPPSLTSTAWLMLGAVVGGSFAGSVFLWGLRHVDAARAGVLTYVEPMVGVAAGVLVLQAPLPALAPLGGLLILGAGWVVMREGAR